MQIFQCLCVLKQHTHLCAPASSDHDCNRRGKAQRTGAGNNQNRDGIVQAELHGVTHEHPRSKGQRGNCHYNRNKDTGNFVCHSGNRRFGTACILYHADNLSEGSVFTNLVGAELQIALLADRCSGHLIAHTLLHRHALAGQGTLVYGRTSADHRTVHRNAAAGTDNHDVPHLYIFHRHFNSGITPPDAGGFRAQVHQSTDGITGLALCPGFQVFSKSNQGQNHSRRFKIEIVAVFRDNLHFSMSQRPRHTKQSGNAINQCCKAANGNQGIHVGAAMPERFETAGIIYSVKVNHRQRQAQLKQRGNHGVLRPVIPAGYWEPNHVPHGKIHENHQENGRTNQAALHFLQAGVHGRSRLLFGSSSLKGSIIASLLHRLNHQRGYIRVGGYNHGSGKQIHICFLHPGNRLGYLLHPGGAGCAGHPGYVKFQNHLDFLAFYYLLFGAFRQLFSIDTLLCFMIIFYHAITTLQVCTILCNTTLLDTMEESHEQG